MVAMRRSTELPCTADSSSAIIEVEASTGALIQKILLVDSKIRHVSDPGFSQTDRDPAGRCNVRYQNSIAAV
jgi:hypothetical protein